MAAAISTASPTSSKVFDSAADATSDIVSGSKLLIGGFGVCGVPENLIEAVNDSSAKGTGCAHICGDGSPLTTTIPSKIIIFDGGTACCRRLRSTTRL